MRVNFEKSTVYNGGNAGVCLKTAGLHKARILFRYTQKIYINPHKYLQ